MCIGGDSMNDWFTVEKIDSDTYVISEYKHWEETHCYLLIGDEKALLIDTGLGVSNIKTVVDKITELPLEIVSTHVHWDHIGGHKFFRDIAVYETEKDWLSSKFPIPLQVVKSNLIKEPCDFPPDFDITKYQVFQGMPERILEDGDLFDLGKRTVKVIHTPGHSPGHICLYELERKYLYSGDLIYKGILYAFYPTTDPIEFMKSVRKVRTLKIERVLPGHNTLNIPTTIINEIDDGFTEIFDSDKLKQGNGIFKFSNFQIHI